MFLPLVTINGGLFGLYLLVAAFVGFQFGSFVEYRKKYNLVAEESEYIHAVEDRLKSLEQALVENVKKALQG